MNTEQPNKWFKWKIQWYAAKHLL